MTEKLLQETVRDLLLSSIEKAVKVDAGEALQALLPVVITLIECAAAEFDQDPNGEISITDKNTTRTVVIKAKEKPTFEEF